MHCTCTYTKTESVLKKLPAQDTTKVIKEAKVVVWCPVHTRYIGHRYAILEYHGAALLDVCKIKCKKST